MSGRIGGNGASSPRRARGSFRYTPGLEPLLQPLDTERHRRVLGSVEEQAGLGRIEGQLLISRWRTRSSAWPSEAAWASAAYSPARQWAAQSGLSSRWTKTPPERRSVKHNKAQIRPPPVSGSSSA